MTDATSKAFGFPAVGRRKITWAFEGGRVTSNGGVMLLGAAERRLGVARQPDLIQSRRKVDVT